MLFQSVVVRFFARLLDERGVDQTLPVLEQLLQAYPQCACRVLVSLQKWQFEADEHLEHRIPRLLDMIQAVEISADADYQMADIAQILVSQESIAQLRSVLNQNLFSISQSVARGGLASQQLQTLAELINDNVSLIVSGALYQTGDDSFCDVDATQDIVAICVAMCRSGQCAEEVLKIAEQTTEFSRSESLRELLEW